jgi:hypothetical protein
VAARKRSNEEEGNEEINEVVCEWFTCAKLKNIHISDPMVQSEALTLATSLGNGQSKAPTGWFDSFKKRHNIVWNGTHYSFESDIALLVVRNTQNEDVEDEEEQEEGGEAAAWKQDISTKNSYA